MRSTLRDRHKYFAYTGVCSAVGDAGYRVHTIPGSCFGISAQAYQAIPPRSANWCRTVWMDKTLTR